MAEDEGDAAYMHIQRDLMDESQKMGFRKVGKIALKIRVFSSVTFSLRP